MPIWLGPVNDPQEERAFPEFQHAWKAILACPGHRSQAPAQCLRHQGTCSTAMKARPALSCRHGRTTNPAGTLMSSLWPNLTTDSPRHSARLRPPRSLFPTHEM